jgi:hypothetical protein
MFAVVDEWTCDENDERTHERALTRFSFPCPFLVAASSTRDSMIELRNIMRIES